VSINLGIDGLSGGIPAELGLLTGITSLNLFGNPQLRGSVPTELVSMTGLTTLLLSTTDLTGSIHGSFCDLPSLDQVAIDCDEMECECCTGATGSAC